MMAQPSLPASDLAPSESRRRSRQTAGFTLIEVLVALVILSIGILGYMAVQFQSVSSRAFARTLHSAMTRGVSGLEELRLIDFQRLSGTGEKYFDKVSGEEVTEDEYDAGTAYKATWEIDGWDAVSDNPNCFIRELKTIGVGVEWKEKGMDYSSVFYTFERGRKRGDIS